MNSHFTSYREAVEMIVEVLRGTSKVQLDATELDHVRRMIERALRADTNGLLTHLDFMTKDRLLDAVKDTGFKTINSAMHALYSATLRVIEIYSGR